MITTIIIIGLYLIVGVGILAWAMNDPWGGLVLEIWYLVIFAWPLLLVYSLWQGRR